MNTRSSNGRQERPRQSGPGAQFFDFRQEELSALDFDEIEARSFVHGDRAAPGDSVRSLINHRWVGMVLFVFLVGAVLRNATLLALTGFMLVVIAAAWLWSRAALRQVGYARRFQHRRAFPGETLELQTVVENRKLLPLGWLQIEDSWATEIGPVDEALLSPTQHPEIGILVNVYTLRWFQRVRRRIPLLARQRGVYRVGPAKAISGDPFSLFERERPLAGEERLIVYPEVKTLAELGLPVKDPLGEIRTTQRLFEDPNRIMGVRDYRPEDGLRHVHWKATARAGQMQTKVYEPTRSVNIVLCLNVATFEQHWRGVWPDMLEYTVTMAASLAYWGAMQHYAVGVVANGTLAHADQPFRVLPSRDRDQLMRLLETLAGVSYFVTAEFGRFLLEESPRLPWGATLVLLTPYVNDSIRASIDRLRDAGRRLVLIVLGKAAPEPIPGVLIHHLPIAGEAPPDLATGDEDAVAQETPRQRFLRERAKQTGEF